MCFPIKKFDPGPLAVNKLRQFVCFWFFFCLGCMVISQGRNAAFKTHAVTKHLSEKKLEAVEVLIEYISIIYFR